MSKMSSLYVQEVFTICPRSLIPFYLYTYPIQVKNCEDIIPLSLLYVQEVLSHFVFLLIQYLSRYYMSKKSCPILSLYLYNTSKKLWRYQYVPLLLALSFEKCKYVIYLYFMSKKSLLYVQEVFTMYPRSLYYISKKSLAKNLYYISK